MNELFSIKDKVAVITGASGVLGGSLAKSFIEAGAKVVALGRNQETLDARVKELTDLGGDAFAVEANVMDIESLESASNRCSAEHCRWKHSQSDLVSRAIIF